MNIKISLLQVNNSSGKTCLQFVSFVLIAKNTNEIEHNLSLVSSLCLDWSVSDFSPFF